ncbi:MAG: hypothetical protein ABIR06_06355 [Cyclobacteriaceae bacterium]
MKTCYTVILLCLLASCLQEELGPDNYDFRGSWDSRKYAMQIFSNGSGVLDIKNRGRCEGNVWVNGDKLVFMSKDDDDEVGYKRFDIDQRPTTDSLGVTYMILDGYRLVKH